MFLALVLSLGSCGRTGNHRLGSSDSVDFNIHIRPLLSDRCFKCHGPDANQRKAKLRLDTPEGAYAALRDDPTSHVIVPGDAQASEVYRRISSTDTAVQMPPPKSNLKLTASDVELIRKWINQGAKYKKHWAFIPPIKREVPASDSDWPHNEIDNFLLAGMEQAGLTPNQRANPAHLLKRVCMDITGLPPTLELQDQFLKDPSDAAYEKVVDALLADPHYGEKMAVHWMDVARYADSHGYQDDGYRTMWPWRDWVIHAFNQNYPFDQFVTWQLAGDLLKNPTKEQLLATGFNRNHKITQEGGVIQEEYRIEYVTDRTNTFGKAFLALTFECAHCHDHKYDPISTKSYYSTFAFFNQVPEKGLVGDIMLASLADPPKMRITKSDIDGILNFINKKDTGSVEVMIMQDSARRRPTYVLKRGVYDAHGDEVGFDVPAAILPFDSAAYGGNNRLALTRWLFDRRNPLTARVAVNRFWQELMGRGLVKTSGDFGMQGEMPSHPELLDWLAIDFREHGWDIKRLVKQIVMSSAYQQSSATSAEQMRIDPENILLSRSTRLRFSAEGSRDLVLASSGILNKQIGGPSSKVYQPEGIWEQSTSGRGELAHYRQDHGDKLYRRGLYSFIKRTVPPPSLLVLDASNRDQCEVKRQRTNTPLQALVMLNDPTVLEASRVLAESLMELPAAEEQVEKAFRLIVCRPPDAAERKILMTAYNDAWKEYSQSNDAAANFVKAGEYPAKEINDKVSLAALMQTIHLIYNLEEAITRT